MDLHVVKVRVVDLHAVKKVWDVDLHAVKVWDVDLHAVMKVAVVLREGR